MKDKNHELMREDLPSHMSDGKKMSTHHASSSSGRAPSDGIRSHGEVMSHSTLMSDIGVPATPVVTVTPASDNVSSDDSDHDTVKANAGSSPRSDVRASPHMLRKRGHTSEVTECELEDDVTKKIRKDMGNGNNNNANYNQGSKKQSPLKRVAEWLKQ